MLDIFHSLVSQTNTCFLLKREVIIFLKNLNTEAVHLPQDCRKSHRCWQKTNDELH